jgi:hypothetical protein
LNFSDLARNRSTGDGSSLPRKGRFLPGGGYLSETYISAVAISQLLLPSRDALGGWADRSMSTGRYRSHISAMR